MDSKIGHNYIHGLKHLFGKVFVFGQIKSLFMDKLNLRK